MKVYKYGDNVDTDVIIPARYLNAPDEKSLASHCMEDIDAQFASTVEAGDIVVGGGNFGCGSSREHAPIALKASGVSCVIASTFARIFIGIPSTSACRSWNAPKRRKPFLPETLFLWILIPASSPMRPLEPPTRPSPSRPLSKTSLPAAACWNRSRKSSKNPFQFLECCPWLCGTCRNT